MFGNRVLITNFLICKKDGIADMAMKGLSRVYPSPGP